MHLFRIVLPCVVLNFLGQLSQAAILDNKQFTIDFANEKEATEKATWSEPDKLTITKKGLGWDGEAASSRDGSITTKPIAIGYSWRTPSSAMIRVTIDPAPTSLKLNSGQESTPYPGNIFVRYSTDSAHWSSWQVLPTTKPYPEQEKASKPGRNFGGLIQIPRSDSAEFHEFLQTYSRRDDVPWASDQEAAAKWIHEQNPDFFAKNIPTIGYVQFLFEGSFYGGQRIERFFIDISYMMSGKHHPPKDPALRNDRDSIPWRFKIEPNGNATTEKTTILESK